MSIKTNYKDSHSTPLLPAKEPKKSSFCCCFGGSVELDEEPAFDARKVAANINKPASKSVAPSDALSNISVLQLTQRTHSLVDKIFQTMNALKNFLNVPSELQLKITTPSTASELQSTLSDFTYNFDVIHAEAREKVEGIREKQAGLQFTLSFLNENIDKADADFRGSATLRLTAEESVTIKNSFEKINKQLSQLTDRISKPVFSEENGLAVVDEVRPVSIKFSASKVAKCLFDKIEKYQQLFGLEMQPASVSDFHSESEVIQKLDLLDSLLSECQKVTSDKILNATYEVDDSAKKIESVKNEIAALKATFESLPTKNNMQVNKIIQTLGKMVKVAGKDDYNSPARNISSADSSRHNSPGDISSGESSDDGNGFLAMVADNPDMLNEPTIKAEYNRLQSAKINRKRYPK